MGIVIIYSFFMADIPFGLEVTVTERGGRDLFSSYNGPEISNITFPTWPV